MVTSDKLKGAVLQATGLYKLQMRSTIAPLLPAGGEPDKLLQKLRKDGFLRVHKGLPGNRSIYQLTKKGAAAAGVSPARGRMIGTQSLLKNLGVLLFCHVSGTQRVRVEAEQLSQVLKVELREAAYCLCQINGKVVVFDCYVPAPYTPLPTIIRHLRKQLYVARKIPALGGAIKDLRYGFALIVATQARRKTIMDAVRTCAPDEKVPLIKRVRIWVEAVEELGVFYTSNVPRNKNVATIAGQAVLFETQEDE